jgi:hypothetical protein
MSHINNLQQNIHLLNDPSSSETSNQGEQTNIIAELKLDTIILDYNDEITTLINMKIFDTIPPSIKQFIEITSTKITNSLFSIQKNLTSIEANNALAIQNELPKNIAKNLAKTIELLNDNDKPTFINFIFQKINDELTCKNNKLTDIVSNLKQSIIDFNPTWLKKHTIVPITQFGTREDNSRFTFPSAMLVDHDNYVLVAAYHVFLIQELTIKYNSTQQLHKIRKDLTDKKRDEKAAELQALPMPTNVKELKTFLSANMNKSKKSKDPRLPRKQTNASTSKQPSKPKRQLKDTPIKIHPSVPPGQQQHKQDRRIKKSKNVRKNQKPQKPRK